MEHSEIVEQVLTLFRLRDTTLKLNEITKALGISSDTPEYLLLKSVLQELCTQKVLQKSSRRKYSLNTFENFTTLQGVIRIKRNSGFIEDKNKGFKLRVKRRHFNTALDGDVVLAKIVGSKKKKKQRAEVINIVERNDRLIEGNIEFYDNIYFLIPKEDKFYIDFIISPNKLNGAKDGDLVKVKLLYWDDPLKSPQAEVIEIISKFDTKIQFAEEYDSILDEYNLPYTFNEVVLNEAEVLEQPQISNVIKNRLDLRKELVITIDPYDAKDFDDALSLKFLDNGNYYLGVHIADVSHFVPDNSQLDDEAFNRGNSVYLVDRVIPMLPEKLSNELCSLKPNRVRLTYSVMLELTPKGAVQDYQIIESVIKSKRRYSYEEVQKIIDTGEGDNAELILNLHKLSQMLRSNRFKSGGVDFSSTEIKFQLNEDKEPVKASAKVSIPSTQLVEECMLLANRTVASHIKYISKKSKFKGLLPFLYRVHDKPIPDKLQEILKFIKSLGVKFMVKTRSSKEINNIVKLFDNRPEKPIVHQIMLRAMAKAEYSDKNIGHFGLGFTDYSHFTSPIRRYPDLIVNRLLKDYNERFPNRKEITKLRAYLEDVGKHCTETERDAMEAERASVRLVQTLMARKYLGKVMNGTISGVTSFGIFVLMEEFYGEGLIYARDLRDDYYYYDEKYFRMIGKRKKKIFRFGDNIKVKIIHVDVNHRKIELEYVR